MKGERMKRHDGFTLVELLVVIAIISVLAALLLPALEKALETGRNIACRNKLHQAMISVHEYEREYHVILPAAMTKRGVWADYMYGDLMGQALLYEANLLDRSNVHMFTNETPLGLRPKNSEYYHYQASSVLVCPSVMNYGWTDGYLRPDRDAPPAWTHDIADIHSSGIRWGAESRRWRPSWLPYPGFNTYYAAHTSYAINGMLRPHLAGHTVPSNEPIRRFAEPPSRKLFFIEAEVTNAIGGNGVCATRFANDAQYFLNGNGNAEWRTMLMPHDETANFTCYDGHVGSYNRSLVV